MIDSNNLNLIFVDTIISNYHYITSNKFYNNKLIKKVHINIFF